MPSTHVSAIAQTKPIKIQLAATEEAWSELRQVLDDHVMQLLGFSNEPAVRAFMFIVDLLTNEDIDSNQRAVAAEHVQQAAFALSPRSLRDMKRYLNEINPGRVVKRRKVVVHA